MGNIIARAVRLGLVLGVVGLAVACGSDDGGGGSDPCATICACVVQNGGDNTTCQNECQPIASSSQSAKDKGDACEDKLDAYGYKDQCKSACDSFDAPSTAPGAATIADFCAKCASCYGQADFDEGYCDHYATGASFDTAACNAAQSTDGLDDPSLPAATLAADSCTQFDDAE